MTLSAPSRQLSGWGRFPSYESPVVRPERYRQISELQINQARIARGCGRSYGDAALASKGNVIDMRRLDRMLDFDMETGILHAEAGLTLADTIKHLLPLGWFPAITPGTQHVTLGGCIASDVHGKNHHHSGSFSSHVDGISLIDATGRETWVDRATDPDLFNATCGGMGLTGVIGEVRLRLRRVESAYIQTREDPAPNLATLMEMLADPNFDDDYTVAWIDCLRGGRGILMRGRHALMDELPKKLHAYAFEPQLAKPRRVPFTPPRGLLNRYSVGMFNEAYYRSHQGSTRNTTLQDYRRFFYPLDGLSDWNRLYGRGGFIQYQCVMPQDAAVEGLPKLLARINRAKLASFLAVLKRMGAEADSLLGFPLAGYTLAMDLPINGARAVELCAELDAITTDHGGRVYLAKDACLDAGRFRQMYPRYPAWLDIKRRVDPENHYASALSQRLGIPND